MKLFWPIAYLASTGLAWYFGARSRPKDEITRKTLLPKDYLLGLNFLLNDETDKAVDVFIKMLEVDTETVETHLAIGKLFRRRGEVDRAIRIHQNLIARPQLDKVYRDQSLYELGQDYLSAGVLDRAERVFLELVNAKTHSSQALRILLDIYQQEKEWEKAIEIAAKYESVTRETMHPVIAQYYCELGEASQAKKQYHQAVDNFEKALAFDHLCVRANLSLAKTYMEQGEYAIALRALKRIKDQNADYLSEAIDLLASCYEKLNQEDELVAYLKALVEEYPRLPVVLILAERIRKWKGDKVAAGFVADYVRRFPSLRGLYLFLNLHVSTVEGRVKDDLHILQKLMKKVLANKPEYQCTSCGFSSKSLHWHCPGCKEWGMILPIHRLEEEPV